MMMLGKIQPGRGPGSLASAGFASHSRALQFAVTARLLLSSGSLRFPSQDSFVFISSRPSSLAQLGRSSSGEKGTRLYRQPAGSSEEQAQGRGSPLPGPQGIRISAAHSSCWVRGRFPGYRCVPAHVPCVPSQRRLSTAITGDTSVPVAEGRDRNHPGKRPGARILAQKKSGVTHLRLAPGTRLLPPGVPPPACTALLLFRSKVRIQAWIGRSLFKSKTDIRGKM